MCLFETVDIIQCLVMLSNAMIYLHVVTQYKTLFKRVAGLDKRTQAISIDGMDAMESHLRVSDEYLCTSTCLVLVVIQTTKKLLV